MSIHLTLSEEDQQLLDYLLPQVSQALWLHSEESATQKICQFAFTLGLRKMRDMRMPQWERLLLIEGDRNEYD